MLTRTTSIQKSSIFSSYINIHSTPKTIKTDQYSCLKNKKVSKFCTENGIKQMFCPGGEQRGCAFVRFIQTLKRKGSAMQLEDNLPEFQEALNYFIVDIKLNKPQWLICHILNAILVKKNRRHPVFNCR